MNLAEEILSTGGIIVANEVCPGVSKGTFRHLGSASRLTRFAIGFNEVFFATVFFTMSDFAHFHSNTLCESFDDRYLLSVKLSEFASSPVLVTARVPRRPRALIRLNDRLKQLYRHYLQWRKTAVRNGGG